MFVLYYRKSFADISVSYVSMIFVMQAWDITEKRNRIKRLFQNHYNLFEVKWAGRFVVMMAPPKAVLPNIADMIAMRSLYSQSSHSRFRDLLLLWSARNSHLDEDSGYQQPNNHQRMSLSYFILTAMFAFFLMDGPLTTSTSYYLWVNIPTPGDRTDHFLFG